MTVNGADRPLVGRQPDLERAGWVLQGSRCAMVPGGRDQSVDARLRAYAAAALAAGLRGRTGDGLRHADDGLDLARSDPRAGPLPVTHLAIARIHVLVLAGRLRQARDEADRGGRDAPATDDRAAMWAGARGLVAQVQGDLTTATSALRTAVTAARRHHAPGLLGVHLAGLATALAMAGDPDGAAEVLRRIDAIPEPVHPVWAAQLQLSRAWVLAAQGQSRRAADLALLAAAGACAAELPCVEAFALHDAARLGRAAQARARLAELATAVDSDLVRAYARSAAARVDRDPHRLEAVTATFEALGAPLLAAETATAAHRAWLAAGRPQQATAAAERARQLARHCPGAATPGLVADPLPATLTRREREIAVLAGASVTSREIAHQLGLSVRTVDNHLAHVYAKLGITGRQQLAAILHPMRPIAAGHRW